MQTETKLNKNTKEQLVEIMHSYSYTAVYEDGTVIEMDRADPNGDMSLTREGGSKFSDVLKKEEESKLISFVIHSDEQSLGVDLRDGHFELNGIPFWQHRPDLESFKDFRIIYYRTVQIEVSAETNEPTSGSACAYCVGWQTNDRKGNNVQRIVVI